MFDVNDLRFNPKTDRGNMPYNIMSNQKPQQRGMAMRAMEFVRGFGNLFRDGMMFRGNRDIYQVYGYKTQICYADCLAKYRRQDIARRIVNLPADAIWCFPPTVGENVKIQALLSDLDTRLHLWDVLNRADRLCAMDDYATLLVGIDDGKALDQPVTPNSDRQIIYLQPYQKERLKVDSYVSDPRNPRYGKPEYYALNANQANTRVFGSSDETMTRFSGTPMRVHWSRVIHIADCLLEDEVFGSPRLVNVFNLLDDALKIAGGSAEVYWLNSRGGLHVDVDKEMDLESGDEADLSAEVDDYSNNLRRVMRTRGVKVTPINMTMADPRQPFNVNINLVSGATGIPQRILLGSEAGQLASEQDRANWATSVKQRRKNFAEPRVIRPLLNMFATIGLMTQQEAQTGTIIWPEAFQMSPLERSQTAAQQARSAANLVKAIPQQGTPAIAASKDNPGGQPGKPDTPGIVTIEEARSIVMLGYDTSPSGNNPNQVL